MSYYGYHVEEFHYATDQELDNAEATEIGVCNPDDDDLDSFGEEPMLDDDGYPIESE